MKMRRWWLASAAFVGLVWWGAQHLASQEAREWDQTMEARRTDMVMRLNPIVSWFVGINLELPCIFAYPRVQSGRGRAYCHGLFSSFWPGTLGSFTATYTWVGREVEPSRILLEVTMNPEGEAWLVKYPTELSRLLLDGKSDRPTKTRFQGGDLTVYSGEEGEMRWSFSADRPPLGTVWIENFDRGEMDSLVMEVGPKVFRFLAREVYRPQDELYMTPPDYSGPGSSNRGTDSSQMSAVFGRNPRVPIKVEVSRATWPATLQFTIGMFDHGFKSREDALKVLRPEAVEWIESSVPVSGLKPFAEQASTYYCFFTCSLGTDLDSIRIPGSVPSPSN